MTFSASAVASSDFMNGRLPAIQGSATDITYQRYPIKLAVADLVAGVVGAVGILPAGHIPVSVEIDADQLDSNGAPAFAYSVGILKSDQSDLSTATADGGAAWVTGQTTGRTAGGAASGLLVSRPLKLVQQAQVDRLIGIKVTGSAATAVAGTLALSLWYRPA